MIADNQQQGAGGRRPCGAIDATGEPCALTAHTGNHLTGAQLAAITSATPGARPSAPPVSDIRAPAGKPSPLIMAGVAVLAVVVVMLVAGQLAGSRSGLLPAVGGGTRATLIPAITPGAGAGGGSAWTRSANYTTCTQWLTQMTPSQRTDMLAPLLPILRQTVDTAASDGRNLLPAFVDAVSATCRTPEIGDPDDYVVTAAAALTFTMDGRFAP